MQKKNMKIKETRGSRGKAFVKRLFVHSAQTQKDRDDQATVVIDIYKTSKEIRKGGKYMKEK